uniref:Collagen type XIV alpha 1 chain n=1 Tax=Scleropages formosus TaxID=113540 RepID=A0A8C9QYG5_SCLFO
MKTYSPLLLLALAALFTVPAQGQVSPPRRLRFKVPSLGKLLVSWKEPRGDFDSYVIIYNTEPDGKEKELHMSKAESKAVIEHFNPSMKYRVKVIAVSGSQRSKPLEGYYAVQHREPGSEAVAPQGMKDTSVVEESNEISGVRTYRKTRKLHEDISPVQQHDESRHAEIHGNCRVLPPEKCCMHVLTDHD